MMPSPDIEFHATTFRAAHMILDGADGIDPACSFAFDRVFLFGALDAALAFIAGDPARFSDTGPAILEIDARGLALRPEGDDETWSSAAAIDVARIVAFIEVEAGLITSRRIMDASDKPAI
jgi:hypothetical protein